MKTNKNDLLQGTLDLLILKVLSTGQLHGWDIAKRIQLVSRERILVKQGSLYPAVHRLEHKGFIEAEWGVSEAGRSAKFYKLTRKGRTQLRLETDYWMEFSESVSLILDLEPTS